MARLRAASNADLLSKLWLLVILIAALSLVGYIVTGILEKAPQSQT